jgi:hypothetical protein
VIDKREFSPPNENEKRCPLKPAQNFLYEAPKFNLRIRNQKAWLLCFRDPREAFLKSKAQKIIISSKTCFEIKKALYKKGIDYEFSKEFAIGLDVKYMINLANKINQDSNNTNSTNFNGYAGTTIERLQHYTAGVSARMSF